MTIRATITKNGETIVMMFGDSYKSWSEQFREFIHRKYGDPKKGWRKCDLEGLQVELEKSRSKWIAWGGLKWCAESEFQNELNREGCQEDEPDNPAPRRFADFRFEPVDKPFRSFL